MIESTTTMVIPEVRFWALNTDAQALFKSRAAPLVMDIRRGKTRGLGAGGEPGVGAAAAKESLKEIEAVVEGTDLVFVSVKSYLYIVCPVCMRSSSLSQYL